MKYGKKKVNRIIEQILEIVYHDASISDNAFEKIEFVREEHLLVDRRTSNTRYYLSEIINDFAGHKMSYKDLMKKYHCSERTMKGLLQGIVDANPAVKDEMEFRTRK